MLLITSPFIKRLLLSPRFYHHTSRYDGYWTLLLQKQQQPMAEQHFDTNNAALSPDIDNDHLEASLDTTNNDYEVTLNTATPTTSTEISNTLTTQISPFVWLQNEKIPLPQKPPPPENCCMSGCAYCVYDIYQEDMEAYKHEMKELRQRFTTANVDLPDVLQTKKKTSSPTQADSSSTEDNDDDDDGMDATMKAFLEMEKKLNAKS